MISTVESLAPDSERFRDDLHELAETTDPHAPGWTRQVFSEPYRASRDWVRRRMADAGLEVHVDPAGNIVGRLAGHRTGAPPVVTGSHTDTVHGGGRFDGIVGVLGAIEAVRRLRETGQRLDHDLLVIDFLGEETNPFGYTCLGSRAAAGDLLPADLDRTDSAGNRLGDALTAFGVDPNAAVTPSWCAHPLHAYLELHIEQGPVLERQGVPLGVVTAIAGIERVLATFVGRADHAGTTPMEVRHDALVAAAKAVLIVEREGCGAPVHGVSTSGRLETYPGSPNVVPERVRLWAEFRSTDVEWLSGVRGKITERIARQAAENGVQAMLDWVTDNPVVDTDQGLQNLTAQTAESLGYPCTPVASGATHDAVHLSRLCPTGMIFVPSRDGRSHCPEEWTDPDHISAGVHLLTATLLRLGRAG
jgi:N-carbamoyl-L-amino-acid hydrolase